MNAYVDLRADTMSNDQSCLSCKQLQKKIKDQVTLLKYYKERLERAEKILAQHKASIDYRLHNDGV